MFLPFHLEEAFSSAFVLWIASATVPDATYSHAYHDTNDILDAMIEGGNRLARLRKVELAHLNNLLQRTWSPDASQQMPQEQCFHPPNQTNGQQHDVGSEVEGQCGPAWSTFAGLGEAYGTAGWEGDINSSNALTQLANALDFDDIAAQIMFGNT